MPPGLPPFLRIAIASSAEALSFLCRSASEKNSDLRTRSARIGLTRHSAMISGSSPRAPNSSLRVDGSSDSLTILSSSSWIIAGSSGCCQNWPSACDLFR